MTEGKLTEGKRTEGKRIEGRRIEGKRTEGKRTEGKRTEGKRTEGRRSIAGKGAPDSVARGMSGAIVWLTGLPSSGKSTLARHVQGHFNATGRASVLLDGDELREVLGVHSYTPDERERFYRALGALAALIAQQGIVVLVAATAPRREERDRVRAQVARAATFVEVWVKTPIEDCVARDPKGLYARARRGELPDLPGMGAEYEPPLDPEVIADGGLDETAVVAIECQIARPEVA